MAARKVFGNIGMLPIALRLEKAVDDQDADTHTVCVGSAEKPHSPERVKQTVACPSCGKSASSHYGFPDRGVLNAEGKLVVLDAKAIAEAKGKPITGKADDPFKIRFHNREKVFAATVCFGSVNNVLPAPGSERSYTHLYRYLATHPHMVAVFTWAPKTKNTHWVIEATGDGRLIASALAYPEEVRAVAAVEQAPLDEKDVALFEQIAEIETSDFDLAAYQNEARAGLRSLIESETGVAVPNGTAVPTDGTDMLAALRATLAAAPAAKRVAAKKAPAKRAPAKRAAVKKTPAKKAPAKRAVKKPAAVAS